MVFYRFLEKTGFKNQMGGNGHGGGVAAVPGQGAADPAEML
jgi:hypothetical protein